MAVWLGLKAAMHRFQTKRIVLEADSTTIVAWIKGETISLCPAIRNIKAIITEHLHSISCNHIFREANQVADYLAKEAITNYNPGMDNQIELISFSY